MIRMNPRMPTAFFIAAVAVSGPALRDLRYSADEQRRSQKSSEKDGFNLGIGYQF
jgi:hypothetical protein